MKQSKTKRRRYSTDLGGLEEERQVRKDDVRTHTILSVCTSLTTRFMLIFYKFELECKN